MPRIIRLNKFGTLAISIPKSVSEATGLKRGDHIEFKIKSIEPLVIAIVKQKPIEDLI